MASKREQQESVESPRDERRGFHQKNSSNQEENSSVSVVIKSDADSGQYAAHSRSCFPRSRTFQWWKMRSGGSVVGPVSVRRGILQRVLVVGLCAGCGNARFSTAQVIGEAFGGTHG